MRCTFRRPRFLLLLLAAWLMLKPSVAESDEVLLPPRAVTKFANPESHTPSPAGSREAVYLIENALLAERLTFPYVIQARHVNDHIELHGRVPTAAIQARAYQIASQAWPGKIANRIVVVPNMAIALPSAPGPQFAQDAKERLEKVAPLAGRKLELRARKDGQLVLSGRADSEEQRLAFARALRGLPGAACVINQMTVATPEPAAMPTASARPFLGMPSQSAAPSKPAGAPPSPGATPGAAPPPSHAGAAAPAGRLEPPRLQAPTTPQAPPAPVQSASRPPHLSTGWGTPVRIIFHD